MMTYQERADLFDAAVAYLDGRGSPSDLLAAVCLTRGTRDAVMAELSTRDDAALWERAALAGLEAPNDAAREFAAACYFAMGLPVCASASLHSSYCRSPFGSLLEHLIEVGPDRGPVWAGQMAGIGVEACLRFDS